MNYESAYKLLEEKNQLHLLRYYNTLSESDKAALLSQIEEIDFSLIDMIDKDSGAMWTNTTLEKDGKTYIIDENGVATEKVN